MKKPINKFAPIFEESEERKAEELQEISKGVQGFVNFNVIVRDKKRSYVSFVFFEVTSIKSIAVYSEDFPDEFGVKDHVYIWDGEDIWEIYAPLTEVLQKIRKAKAELRSFSKGRSVAPKRREYDDYVCKNFETCIAGIDKRYACPYWVECMDCEYLQKRNEE